MIPVHSEPVKGTGAEAVMKVLAFSDVHGDTKALKLLARRIEEESFDFMLIAVDLTNADLLPSWGDRLRQMWEVFQVLEGLEIPYYFVWGLPFREFSSWTVTCKEG
jgi:Icc-related predicted phosphoesterase